ncbi:hypothetical protein B4114_2669 [Geobacillus stearothermophilus]|uniref:Uncharacterized protein n=1 Tax=Geobacillus stearothermophilus TaxID=1422 RepID=A0A150NAV5_GEOSE|nr:hypothetical protein B4114_2669 [Geobacillus stearothermophilus]
MDFSHRFHTPYFPHQLRKNTHACFTIFSYSFRKIFENIFD